MSTSRHQWIHADCDVGWCHVPCHLFIAVFPVLLAFVLSCIKASGGNPQEIDLCHFNVFICLV